MRWRGRGGAGRQLKRRALSTYHDHSERLSLDRLVGPLEGRRALRTAEREQPWLETLNGVPGGRSMLVATNNAGPLLIDPQGVRRLLPGAFYGISRRKGEWLVFQRQQFGGRILGFRIEQGKLVDLSLKIVGLSPGVHQIDVINDDLWVADTYNNRLLRFDCDALKYPVSWRRHTQEYHPSGVLSRGRDSQNYRHFNSVYAFNSKIMVVAHNETSKTGRQSTLFVLAEDGRVEEERPLRASNAHNVVITDNGETTSVLSCASMEGTLRENGRDVFSTGQLTRGLAVGPDVIVLGASALGDRKHRTQLDAKVIVLTRTYDLLSVIAIRNTQVHEIRLIDGSDLGLSQASRSAGDVISSA